MEQSSPFFPADYWQGSKNETNCEEVPFFKHRENKNFALVKEKGKISWSHFGQRSHYSLFVRRIAREKGTGRRQRSFGIVMYLTRAAPYAVKLSINQSAGTQVYRKGVSNRGTVGSAFVLATVGLSMSMFSLKQMLSSKAPQNRLRRLQ